jgi:Cu-Zn family superoxide dismutase
MQLLKKYLLSFVLLFFAIGCAQQEMEQEEKTTEPATDFTKAVAIVHPTDNGDVTGTVTFQQEGDSVRVQGEFDGLSEGKHGFHIHEYGDCTAGDATSAGGHYNPTGNDHGSPTQDNRHMGDMGNLVVADDGTASINYVDAKIKLNGPNSIIGRGIVIHGGEDDFESQPSGAAGPRMGCGVVGVANPDA